MGSDGDGRGAAAAAAMKPRKRQLVMESSDSEADEYCISTRQNAGATASVGNAGASGRDDGDQLGEKAVAVSSEKVSEVKSTDGEGSEKNRGVELERSSPQPVAKKIRAEGVHGSGGGSSGGAAKGGNGGKMLPRGLPTWRFEKPEVRGGRVLDEKGVVDMKESSASKVKEQVLSLDDRRRHLELQKHEKRTPLKTDLGKTVDPGQQEVIRLQGKRGVLKILPKNDKLVRDTGDGKILLKKTKVDGETGNGKMLINIKVDEKTGDRIPTKRGVLKLLPKNNDGKFPPNNVKVDGETGGAKMLTKHSRVDKESSDDMILTNKTNLDGAFSGHMPMKNSTMDLETVTEKFQPRSSKADRETNESYKGYEEKSGALMEFQKQDANDEKRVMGKLVSPIMLRKSDPSVVGVSLGQRMKQQNSKQQLKNSSLNHHRPSLSQKDEDTKSSEHKKLKKRLLECKGLEANLSKKAKSEVTDLQGTSGPVLNKLETKKPRGGPRNKLKQDVRNQIKNILLDNGWNIELRRRKNKDYVDSVYLSPEGTTYWSITKAYAVYQEQFQNPRDGNFTGCSSKSNNTIPGSDATSKDDLAMLKKNIVKRRTNKEIYGAKKKLGGSKSKGSKDILTNKSSRNKHQNMEDVSKIKHRGCGLLVRGSSYNMEDNMDGYVPYEWKRTVYSWMIDLGVIFEDADVKYMNYKRTRPMLEGKITRRGIFCGCCSKILTAAKFELHAGSKEKQPYANIFLEDCRISLLQCLHDAWEKHTRYEKKGFYKIDHGQDEHDDTCAICGDGGDLLCCDHCTSTFHLDCLGIKMPCGEWYCRSCLCRFCGSAQEKTSSSPELLSCLQCSRKYHQACSPGTGTDSVCTKPSTSIDCFCSPGCRKVYNRLKKLLGIKNNIEAGFSWSLVRCFANDQGIPPKSKAQSLNCNSKTALAFAVMDECFQPHIDERSGINMIHNVVYNCGSDFSRLDFSGFYTFILERGDEVISAASVRIHGTDLAEMPFIGTRGMYRHQGMCRRLLSGIESALCSVNVRKLVISAVPEMEKTWTAVFGFKPVEPSKKQKIKSVNILIINGTSLLEKRLLPTGTVDNARPANAVADKTDVKMFGEASGSVTPVHVSCEFDVANDLEIKCHGSSHPLTENSSGLTSDQPPVAEENDIKRTLERTLPGVNCGDNMQLKPEADDTQEDKKCRKTNGNLIAENNVAEQKCEDTSDSSHSNSHATPAAVDPCSCLSNEVGKGESCPSSEISVGAARVTGKTESNVTSNSPPAHCANQEYEKSCVAPVDTNTPLVTMDEKPDNHELKIAVADGYIQSSMEVKILEDTTNIASGTSVDSYIDKYTSEHHSASAVDSGVFLKGSVQQMDIIEDNDGSLLPDLKHPSCKGMVEKFTKSKSLTSDIVETEDVAIKVRMAVESYNEVGISAPVLDISNVVCKVVVKPTQTCGEDQLCGEDVICNNNRESDLASREPVNA